MIDKKLIEAFNIRYGWSHEAVLSITEEQVRQMTMEEFLIYADKMEEIYPDGTLPFRHLHQDAEGNIIVSSEED